MSDQPSKTLEEIAREFLQEQGYRIEKSRGVPTDQTIVIREATKPGEIIRLGLVSDEHFCSKHQQLSALRDFYAYADSRGVEAYISSGDTVDGGRMHRDQEFELFIHGASAQVNYAADVHPRSSNGPTYRVDGNHDYSHFNQAGHSFGAELEVKRPDLKFMGYAGAVVKIGDLTYYAMHGAGGVAYARTYKLQRIAEQLNLDQRGVDVFGLGHYHVSAHLPRYRGVNCIMLPCWQSQTPFLRRLGLLPDIGGVVMEIEFGQHGVRDIRVDWRMYEPKENDF